MKKLVGEGKPFHSAVDKTAALLKRKVGTGAEFMKELMGVSGVKPTELQERGLTEIMGMPRMTHDQFMANLATRPAPAIREKVLGDEPDQADVIRRANARARDYASNYAESADTSREAREMRADELRRLRENHRPQMMEFARRELEDTNLPTHETYTLPGGENYREMLIKAPKGADQFKGVSGHFGGEPNILASMRLKDRTGPNGEKLLHLEELQSDWHQQGREKGYHDPEKLAQSEATIKALKAEHKRLGEVKAQVATPEEREAISEQRLAIMGEIRDATIRPSDHVPNAPFKKNWEEMALKRLIHHAAEKGYHGIVVTPGQEQADRYSLEKHINAVNYIPGEERLIAKNHKGHVVIDKTYTKPEDLPEHIGKELAQKLLATEPTTEMDKTKAWSSFAHPNPMHILTGQDIRVGGEGMRGFYDKKVPNILNSIGKKYGVKTQLHGHPIEKEPANRLQVGEMTYEDPAKIAQLHHFPITEEMRKDVLTNGLPLYNKGGTVHMADGGDMDQMQLAMMDKKVKKPKKPPTPLHFAPAPALSKKDIEAHAERIARQMAGLDNPNNKTLQQLARENNLQVDIRSGGPKSNLPVIDYSKLGKNAFTVGVPGDPSIGGLVPHDQTDERHGIEYPKAGEYLQGIGGEQLTREVPMYGGYMYGGYGHPAGWASDLGASRGMFNVVQKLAKEDPSREIYGHYHKMTPESLNHAVHFLDAMMAHPQLHNMTDEQRNMLNYLMREVQTTTNKKHRPYASFPGFENHGDVMAHAHLSSDMRKKIISLIGKDKYLPGGTQRLDDAIFAASHPELRNIETGAGGNAIIKFDPKGNLKKSLSLHPTYGHDIPSQTIGQTRYTTPFQILAPRSHHRAVTQIAAMGKKVEPFNMAKMSIIREPIDEQYINQMGQYEHAMRKRLGYKKGGKIKMADGGQVDIKNIGVNEAPDMDVKQYFMPRPMTSNVFPVGGIQQAPQAPGQPQQPPMQPNQPQPGQQLQQQQPSNILQMTRQGQAMNAMTPPKSMARGGHVDRDTMMFELMNRKTKVKHG